MKLKEIYVITLLRLLTLISKFLFVMILLNHTTAKDFSSWIIYSSTISYTTLILGAEIYNISFRKFVSEIDDDKNNLLVGHLKFSIFAYMSVFIFAIIYCLYSKLDNQYYLFILILIAIFDHISMELHRLSIYCDRQIPANVILLIKSFCWMAPYTLLLLLINNIDFIWLLIGWLMGNLCASIYGIKEFKSILTNLIARLDINLSIRGIRTVVPLLLPFWILTFSLRTPQLLDRYLIQMFCGSIELSAYGYYSNFSNGLQALFDTIIISKYIPASLKLRDGSNILRKQRLVTSFNIYATFFWIFAIIILYLLISYFGIFFIKYEILPFKNLFIVIALSQAISSVASIFQYSIYSSGNDHDLARGATIYAIVVIASMFAFAPILGMYGVAHAFLLGSVVLLAIRVMQWHVIINQRREIL